MSSPFAQGRRSGGILFLSSRICRKVSAGRRQENLRMRHRPLWARGLSAPGGPSPSILYINLSYFNLPSIPIGDLFVLYVIEDVIQGLNDKVRGHAESFLGQCL